MGTKTDKPLVFFMKTENQMLKNEKSVNRNDHQNQKTEVFCNKNWKTDLKNSQNRKTENPSAPLIILFITRGTAGALNEIIIITNYKI